MTETSFLLSQCRQSADLFDLSGRMGLESEDFITKLMHSELGQYLYSQECIDMWLGAAYVMDTLETELTFKKGKLFPAFFLQWVGFLYRYWSLITQDTSVQIIEQAPIQDLRQMYQGLHVMSYEEVVNVLREKTDAD